MEKNVISCLTDQEIKIEKKKKKGEKAQKLHVKSVTFKKYSIGYPILNWFWWLRA